MKARLDQARAQVEQNRQRFDKLDQQGLDLHAQFNRMDGSEVAPPTRRIVMKVLSIAALIAGLVALGVWHWLSEPPKLHPLETEVPAQR
jgi:ferric-dicitrate binding protein FerR (iron transport regulator)